MRDPGDPWWINGPDYDPDERECADCDGRGRAACACKGEDDDCENCHGHGDASCYTCGGSGLEPPFIPEYEPD